VGLIQINGASEIIRLGSGPGIEMPNRWYPTLDGVAPSAGWNFVTGRSIGMSAADAFTGLNLTAAGLTINDGNDVAATAALRTVMAGNYTVLVKLAGRAGAINAGVISYSATEAPIFLVAEGIARAYKQPTSLDNGNRFIAGPKRLIAMARSGSARKVTQNGCIPVSDATVQTASPSAIPIGRFNGAAYLNDDIEEMYVWNFYGSDAGLERISTPAFRPLINNNTYIRGMDQHRLTVGANALQYEYTQPWSCLVVARLTGIPDVAGTYLGSMFFTNVSAASSVFPGYEFWIRHNANKASLAIRIINDITDASPKYIGVYDGANWADNNVHVFLATYDGSGTAAGCKIYADGVSLSLTTESDTLGGLSIIGGTQTFLVGNQTNRLGYYHKGDLGFFHMDDVARDATWAATYSNVSSLPAVDADTVLHYDDWGTSGTTITDKSVSGLNGTLSTALMRMPEVA
jgi:hypothetical protein